MRKRVLLPLVCLVLLTSWAASAQKKAAGAAGKPKPGANGALTAEEEKAPPPGAAQAHACLQMHNGPGVTWNIDVTFDPNVYSSGYTITGGTITGTICHSPATVTGGKLGSALKITGTLGSGCAPTVTIVGNANVPDGYAGTYGFPGPTGFTQHTLFLGFQKSSCP